jgi:hypothetical protein
VKDPRHFYTPLMRAKHAFWFIRKMADESSASLEATQSKHIGPTYGLKPDLIKRIKARFRNELSFRGGEDAN